MISKFLLGCTAVLAFVLTLTGCATGAGPQQPSTPQQVSALCPDGNLDDCLKRLVDEAVKKAQSTAALPPAAAPAPTDAPPASAPFAAPKGGRGKAVIGKKNVGYHMDCTDASTFYTAVNPIQPRAGEDMVMYVTFNLPVEVCTPEFMEPAALTFPNRSKVVEGVFGPGQKVRFSVGQPVEGPLVMIRADFYLCSSTGAENGLPRYRCDHHTSREFAPDDPMVKTHFIGKAEYDRVVVGRK